MISKFCFVLFILKLIEGLSALVELPRVEENNILRPSDHLIRETIDQIFSAIRVRVSERPNLKQYLLIHNNLTSASLHDYTNLIEVAKLSRVDKTKINNQTQDFIAILNGILEEDIKHDQETEDEFVLKHIDGFVKNLEEYSEGYKYEKYDLDIIIAELLNNLEKNESSYETQLNSTSHLETDQPQSSNIDNPDEFWVPNTRRIFQGQKATIKQYPFMVSIQIFNHFQCAGSILKNDLIITAASCLQLAWNNRFFRENPTFLSVRVGSTFHNLGGEIIPVLEVYFHPDYEPKSLRNNLCMIRLYRILNLSKTNKRVKKIDFDRNAHPLPSNTDGITIIGWGARERDNVLSDPNLSFAVLDFYSIEECQNVYSPNYVTKTNFCGGFLSRGGGACNRDIGGPGIANNVLAGVVSFGSPTCGTPNAPTVFTKVGFYAKWIESILEQEIPKGRMFITTRLPYTTYTVPFVIDKSTFQVTPIVPTKKTSTTPDENLLRVFKDENLLRRFVNVVMNNARLKKILMIENSATSVEENFAFTPFDNYDMTSGTPESIGTQLWPNIEKAEFNGNEDFYEVAKHEMKPDIEKTTYKSRIGLTTPSQNNWHELFKEDQIMDIERDIIKLMDEINKETDKENPPFKIDEPLDEEQKNIVFKQNQEATQPLISPKSDLVDTDTYNSDEKSDESGLEIEFENDNDTIAQTNTPIGETIPNQSLLDIVSEALKDEIDTINSS